MLVSIITRETPSSVSVSAAAPWNAPGTVIAPVAMMKLWPVIRRGSELTVPIVPGLVSVQVVSAKSSGVSLPSRDLRICSLNAAKKPAKSRFAAVLDVWHDQAAPPVLAGKVDGDAEVQGTIRRGETACRSCSVNCAAIDGTRNIDCTIAQPIRCVKLTFGR